MKKIISKRKKIFKEKIKKTVKMEIRKFKLIMKKKFIMKNILNK